MNTMKLKVISEDEIVQAVCEDGQNCSLLYTKEYNKGDRILLEVQDVPCYCAVQFEDSMPWQLIYVTKKEISYRIPSGSDRIVFSPKAFSSDRHVIRARFACDKEIREYQNLALNVYDRHGDNGYFPHSSANVETRGEAVFASYNAIDGTYENKSHGEWPYQSWGINKDPNAAITIAFGRNVKIDKVKVTLRSDFPHDNWWVQGDLIFSDKSTITAEFKKTHLPQEIKFESRTVSAVTFTNLIKSDELSPFPALTQIEVWGENVL